MNVFKSIQSAVKSMFPTSEGRFYPLTNTSYNVSQLTRTDYLRLYTSRQYVAISTIANSVAELEKGLTRSPNDDKPIDHKHFDLLTYDLIVKIISSIQLTGTCFLYKNMIGKTIDSLDFLRTDLVEYVEDSDGRVTGYRYNGRNTMKTFSKNDIIEISLYSPLASYPYNMKGVSPMQAVAIQAEMDSTANRRNRNFFKNGASAGDLITSDKVFDKEQKKRFLQSWKSDFQGVNNSNKVAFLDNGIKYEKIGMSQKELDFVESRRFTRDEVFATFKVPKSIVGVSDDVNRASALVAENTFYRVCIRPLATMIQEVFNKELFKGIGYFQFLNIVPADSEQLLNDLNSGAITINEYRQERGRKPLKDGDILKLSPMMFDKETQFEVEKNKTNGSESMIAKTLKKHIKGTPEYREAREKMGEEIRNKKIQRTTGYEIKYEEEVKKLFQDQEKMIIEYILSQKGMKRIKPPMMDSIINTTKRLLALKPVYQECFQTEGTNALNMVGVNTMFEIGNPKSNKWINDNISLVAKEVNSVTKEKLFDQIKELNDLGKGADEMAQSISGMFQEFSEKRAKAIARTEITRASTEAEIQAFEQSKVVEGKERYTALDERTCQYCFDMHGKTIGLRTNFFNKGDDHMGRTYDYADIPGPALHTNCRCTILPIVK